MQDEKNLPYDDTSPKEILKYAQNLIGMTFSDVLKKNSLKENYFSFEEEVIAYNNPRGKGTLGNLLEKHYFMYEPNSNPEPDFEKAGVELKTTPYEKTKNGIRAGERLVITMIPNTEPIENDFRGSHLEKKLRKILMIWYHRIKQLPRTDYRIDYVNLYELYSKICEKDLDIILEDYKIIVDKIISGNAHKLSEGDTKYLGACTKGSTAEKSLRPQYYNDNIPAKRRAFSLKQSYMSYILRQYVDPGLMNYDSIFGAQELKYSDFDQEILKKINKFVGYTVEQLCEVFNLPAPDLSKQINKSIVNKILGVNTENSEEFEKANIVIKTVRVKKNGIPRESMSFPKFNIIKFTNTNFYDSYVYNFFESTRFLFVVFKENTDSKYELSGAKFWNMPINELETIGQYEWNLFKDKFNEGINFSFKTQKNGKITVHNDLPKKSETRIFHIRPHSSKAAYVINNKKYGSGNERDMDTLPNGDKMTNQCFWLNNDYIAEIIKDV